VFKNMTLKSLGLEAINQGQWEEFYSGRSNSPHPDVNPFMRDWHKNNRLELEGRRRRLLAAFEAEYVLR
jgi:hypothetical protein